MTFVAVSVGVLLAFILLMWWVTWYPCPNITDPGYMDSGCPLCQRWDGDGPYETCCTECGRIIYHG